MKNPDPLEKDIEKKVVDFAKAKGCIVYKFTSPSRRSVPDRLFISPKGIVFFMELKRKGQKPTPSQAVEIDKIRRQGVSVFVIDNVDLGKAMVEGMLKEKDELEGY